MERKIYLDNASTTYVSNEVLNEMMPCFNSIYGNAGSLHSFGRDAMAIVDRARDRVKEAINTEKSNKGEKTWFFREVSGYSGAV